MPEEPQPVCAIHLATAATGTCARCGNYVCAECTEHGHYDICPTCRERLGLAAFPFTRDEWSVGGIWSHCWERYQKDWPVLLLASVVLIAISFGVSFAFQLFVPLFEDDLTLFLAYSGVSQLVQTVVNLALSLGFIAISLDVVLGRKVEAARVFAAIARIWKALLQYIVVLAALWLPLGALVALPIVLVGDRSTALLIVGIEAVVLAFPLVYVALGLLFMQYEIVHDPSVGPLAAIVRSWQLARGQRWPIFGVSFLAAVVGAGGLLLCCVGVIATYPLAMLILAALYLALRTGSGLP